MQAQERPVFRQDLVAEAIEEQGAKYIDVMDPDSGNVFRFYEVEYSLACAMDGKRDVAGIVKWAQEELGLTPSPKEVQSVIATLADLRFIETGATMLSDVPEAKASAKSSTSFDDYGEATTVGASPMDEELARGIVVGTAARGAAAMDVELGHAGTSGAKAGGRDEAMPKADFDLGASGAAAASAKPPRAPVDDIALGASGAREPAKPAAAKTPAAGGDLSMDLSDHLAVKPSDVKEAVRASKVMTAVEVPKELQDELDRPAAKPAEKAAEKAVAKAAEKPAEKAVAKPAEKVADKAVAKAAEKPAEKAVAKPAEKAADKAAKKPAVELPKQAPGKQPVAPPAPQQRVNPALVILLILAAVGAGAYFFWKFVLAKPDAAETSRQKTAPPRKPGPPPPPVEAMAKIALETPPAQDVKSPVGALETVEAPDKDVKGGDVLATLVGAKALSTEIANLQKDVDKGAPALEAAQKELADAQQKENNQAGVTAAQAKVDRVKKPLDDKKATIAKKQADLDKLTIKAQTDGKLGLLPTAKVGQKVGADEVIAKITRPTVPVATFKIPPTTKIGADGNISITAGDKTIVCTVSDAQTESIKVTCPADAGLAAGADVKFKLPK
jgi:hypothetical protein